MTVGECSSVLYTPHGTAPASGALPVLRPLSLTRIAIFTESITM
jgi:hypothetical protein